MKEISQRKNIRLKGYDYSKEGLYFITICIKNREQILAKIDSINVGANCVRPKIILSKIGTIIKYEIERMSSIYENIKIDEYVIMPNHIHIIINITGRTQFAPTISRIIKQFKGKISKIIGYQLWQKNYYEHIIRDEKEYWRIKEYIVNNPENWKNDKYY